MQEIKKYAVENKVPIIQDEGLKFLLETIKKHQALNILEIGTAIGYTSIQIAQLNKNIKITTLEINEDMYNKAVENVQKNNLENQINLNLVDGLKYETNEIFDFIFIDAAKAQYIRFFERFEKNLVKGGVIFTDNLSFHGFVENMEMIKSRNLRQLVNKIKKFILFLENNSNYKTTFYDVGDGISISIKN